MSASSFAFYCRATFPLTVLLRSTALVVVFLTLPVLTWSQVQSGVIEGRVLNPATGDYLLNARVSVDGVDREALTDSTGFFRLTGVPAGAVTLRVIYPGFEVITRQVEVGADLTARQDFELGRVAGREREAVLLDAYSVEATREMDANVLAVNEQRYAPNIKNVIAAEAFGDVSEGNLGEFVKRLPGLSIIEAAGDASELSIRGFEGAFSPITMDGLSTPSASSSATSASRGNNLEQISISNIARIEVIKSPMPSVPAHFLGGSVNLIRKSSFERSKPQMIIRGTLQFTADDYSYSKSPGPGTPETRKLRPGYDFSYVNPLTKNFGFTISSLMSDQFGKLLGPQRTWEFATAQGGSVTAPYLRTLRTTEDSRETKRESHAVGVDWRPWEPLTLNVGFRQGVYDLFTAPNRLQFNTGNNPASYSDDHTQGRSGGATVVHQQIWTGKVGTTNQYTLSGKYRQGQWSGDFAASTSKSDLTYPDLEWGFFRGATTRLTPGQSPALTYRGFSPYKGYSPALPEVIELKNGTTGQVIDWKDLSKYQIMSVSADQRNAVDTIDEANVNLRREFVWSQVTGALQVGGLYQKRALKRDQWTPTWSFVGADGLQGTADDTAAPFVDPILHGIDAKFNTPRDIQWPDLRALYQLYQQRPQYFVLQQPAAYITQANSTERISETVTAGYVQGELRLLKNRVLILGGVRFERTENVGTGLLRDREAIYQRDAAGNLLRGPNGQPIPITTDPLSQAKLEYKLLGKTESRTYDDFFPSVNVTINVRDDLLLRLGAGRTMGRPNFNNIVPNIDIDEDSEDSSTGVIRARNPGLKPWIAKNYDVSLEYYTKSGGVISVGVFRKNLTGAFGQQTVLVDQAIINAFDLDPIYMGWDFISTFNVGQETKMDGYELNLSHSLDFIHRWTKGISVFGNVTKIEVDGPSAVQRPSTNANWGISYANRKLSVGLAWNYVGHQWNPATGIGEGGVTGREGRTTLDVTSQFRFSPRFSFFFNARNLTDEKTYALRYSNLSPDYSRVGNVGYPGVKMSAGIKGTF